MVEESQTISVLLPWMAGLLFPKFILLSTLTAGASATPVSHCCLKEGGSFGEEMSRTSQKLHTLPLLVSRCPELGHTTRPHCKAEKDLHSKRPQNQPIRKLYHWRRNRERDMWDNCHSFPHKLKYIQCEF